jgi:hypothetical protein
MAGRTEAYTYHVICNRCGNVHWLEAADKDDLRSQLEAQGWRWLDGKRLACRDCAEERAA